MSYAYNKSISATINKKPTMTDQAAAKSCDRNVIIERFMVHGQIPQGQHQPIYADFTRLPRDLKGFLRQAQSVNELRKKLPGKLQNLTMDALLRLTPNQLNDIIKTSKETSKDNNDATGSKVRTGNTGSGGEGKET